MKTFLDFTGGIILFGIFVTFIAIAGNIWYNYWEIAHPYTYRFCFYLGYIIAFVFEVCLLVGSLILSSLVVRGVLTLTILQTAMERMK